MQQDASEGAVLLQDTTLRSRLHQVRQRFSNLLGVGWKQGIDPQDPGPGFLTLKQKTTLSFRTASSHSQLFVMLITTDKFLLHLNRAGQSGKV